MNNLHYVLKGHEAVEVDLMTWAKSFLSTDRHVGKTTIGDVDVSTVFIGGDHNWDDGPPLLFETMVFGGPLDQEQERYTTWEEAETGHALMVERVKEAVCPSNHE